MTITEFNDANLTQIRKDIDAALEAVNTKYGIKLSLGNFRYDANNFTGKLEAGIVKNGQVVDKAASVLQKHAAYYLGSDFDVTKPVISSQYGPLTVVGINPRSEKRRVILQTTSGKRMNCSVETVRRAAGLPNLEA